LTVLKKGTQAPEFDLVDQDGKRHTLQSLLAKGPLILYFYPADFTPGCTREACTFRDL
jgi:peroxiredoxin Q/BCP